MRYEGSALFTSFAGVGFGDRAAAAVGHGMVVALDLLGADYA
jgi:hypothetical protein